MFCFVFNGFCLTFRVAHLYESITYIVLYLLVRFVVCMLTVLFFVCVIVHDTVFCDIQTDSPTYVHTCIHTYVQTDGRTDKNFVTIGTEGLHVMCVLNIRASLR